MCFGNCDERGLQNTFFPQMFGMGPSINQSGHINSIGGLVSWCFCTKSFGNNTFQKWNHAYKAADTSWSGASLWTSFRCDLMWWEKQRKCFIWH